MRDHYVGDISDILKFSLLRALAQSDRTIGIAWYYVEGTDKLVDGRHTEWQGDASWQALDPRLHAWLSSRSRAVHELEDKNFWNPGTRFHRSPIPKLPDRERWLEQKRSELEGADLVFLDPDNGIGRPNKKHATLSELHSLRQPGRTLGFITFPHRNSKHIDQLRELHRAVQGATGASVVRTLRTAVSLPGKQTGRLVPRIRWFTFLDVDLTIDRRLAAFAELIGRLPQVRAVVD